MPSKRKKNKRRMRRVQAQRRSLEDQYGFSGKGAQGVCARVPVPKTSEPPPAVPEVVPVKVPAKVPVPKTSEPPPAVPAVVPVKVPAKVPVPKTSEPPPAVPTVVPVKVPTKESVVKEIPATDATKAELLKAAEVPVKPPAEEPAVMKETKSVSDPVTEVTAPIDEQLPIPTESEIPVENTAPVATEMHVVAEPVETSEREVKAVAEESMVIPEEKAAAVKHTTETSAADVESVIEASVDTNKPVVEVVEGPAVELEATSDKAEPVDIHIVTEVEEGAHATSEPEKPLLEATVEPQATPLEEPSPLIESSCDPVAEGFIVTESSVAVEAAVLEKQIPKTTIEVPEVSSQMLVETIPAPEPELVPEEIFKSQDDLMAQVETESKKDLAVDGTSLTVDTINGCLGGAEVAIEG